MIRRQAKAKNVSSSPPLIGIIGGKGQMGSLFADFFREKNIKVLISDLGTTLSNEELAARCDITIVSVPMSVTKSAIDKILPHLNPRGAIMDLTSLKAEPIRAMLKSKNEVLGLHPMFGSTNAIPGQTIIVCRTKQSGKWSEWMENLLSEHGVKLEYMSPKQHDKIMNIAQGLVHFAEIVFSDAIRRCNMPLEQLLKFTGKASELKILLAARILAQDSSLYGNIQIQNPLSMSSLKQFRKSTEELFKIVAKKDLKAFQKYFERDRKFFSTHLSQAYRETSYLIDCLLQVRTPDRTSKQPKLKAPTPTHRHLALLGPAHTFSDAAASKYLTTTGSQLKKFYCRDISEVFELLESGKVQEAIVPAENKLEGTVRETLDNLFARKVHITGQVELPISHCLVTLKGAKKSGVKKIISHSQALSQCRNYLRKHFPKAEMQAISSTATALELLITSNNPTLAAIVSPLAAGSHENLLTLAKNIQDNRENITKFYILNRGHFTPKSTNSQSQNTAIVFHFDKDSPGSLATVFQDFAASGINLTRIESRPTKSRFGDYLFYLDFAGTPNDQKVTKILSKLQKKVAFLKVLGCYW